MRRYVAADGWMAYIRRSGGGKLEDQAAWLKERFFQHGGNAEVVRQDLLREQGVGVSLRTVERAVAPWRRSAPPGPDRLMPLPGSVCPAISRADHHQFVFYVRDSLIVTGLQYPFIYTVGCMEEHPPVSEPKAPPPGQMRRTIRALTGRLQAAEGELAILEALEAEQLEAERDFERTHRLFLAGHVVLGRALPRPPLVGWLARALAAGLSRDSDRSRFCLTGEAPLIPPADWEGWPDPRPTDRGAVGVDLAGMTAGKRRRRIDHLRRARTAILERLKDVAARYAPARESANKQRKILVGYVVLQLAFQTARVRRWLRKLLTVQLTEARDRALFGLDEAAPLVPETDRAGLPPVTPRASATRRLSNDGAAAADGGGRDPRARARGAGGGSRADGFPGRAAVPVAAGEDAAARPAPGPIPGWRPCRIPVQGSSDTGVRTKQTTWGARLTGRAAVAVLPADLRGRRIMVTDSNGGAWLTTITDVVSRDHRTVTVRNSGRPGRDAASRRSEESGASST